MFLLIVLYVLSALSFTIAKGVLYYGKPIFFVGFRMIIAGLVLLFYRFLRYRFQSKINWVVDGKWFLLAAIVHIYAAFVLDLVALEYMSSFKAALIYTLSPFIAAIFSYFFFKEKMTYLKILGLLIGFVGFIPILIAQNGDDPSWSDTFFISWPELMMVGSVIAAVWGWVIMRYLIKKGYTPVTINGISKFGGGVLALVTSLFIEGWRTSPVYEWKPFLYLTGLIIILVNLFFYNLYGYLLKKYTATFLSFAGFLSPIFAALFGWIWLGESVHWTFFISIFMIAIGLALFYYEELRQGYITR